MEVIRFQCPACSAALTVPPAAAGFQGPCPKCSVEIIGPNPAQNLPASLPPSDPPAKAFEAFPDSPIPKAPPLAEPEPQSLPSELEVIPPTHPFTEKARAPDPEQIPSGIADPLSQEIPSERNEPDKEPLSDTKAPSSEHPDSHSPDVLTPAPKNPGISKAALILSCLTCTALAFFAGFLAAEQRAPQVTKPIYTTETNEIPKPEPKQESVLVTPAVSHPNAATTEIVKPEELGPEATLNAFLSADGWLERSTYAVDPENVRPKMEARSINFDDGPIETTEISLFGVTPEAHVFKITTPKIPGSFPVAVIRNNNSWEVDWEAFMEFYDDRFVRFANGEGGEKDTFRLLVKPADSEDPESLFVSYKLNPPFPGREQTAYVAKGSAASIQLRGIFERKAGYSEEVFDSLMQTQGPPMVVALSYKTNSEGKSFLQIEDIVSIRWGPS